MGYTLLLADDSITIQRIVELTFASEDIAVVAFSDGDHAIASLDRTIPDIVLADVGMPGRTGYEVSHYIKNSPPLAHIPVLLLTGAFEPVDQAKALEAGCDGILIKPFEPQFVISRVKELLRKPKPGSKEDEVEQYFEELDKAFANLSASPPPPPPPPSPPAADATMTGAMKSPEGMAAESPASPRPVQFSSAPADSTVSAAVPASGATRVEEPARTSSSSTAEEVLAARPSLTDAFAALLEAERSANGVKRPVPTMTAIPRAILHDEVIERVTRRVLEQLSDAVVRETVTEIVQATTERLVREEIERIKSNIK